MGSARFSLPSLEALLDAGHDVVAVYTQPPRPAGRGHRPRPSPVQASAEANDIPIRVPATLKDADEQARFQALALDAAVVVAYGLILPPAILAAPRLGCFNVHASLLPRWRGAAPIQRAILAGDSETGVTVIKIDEGLDTGPMLLRQATPITATTTAGALHDELAAIGARLITSALSGVATGELSPIPQPAEGATYAHKIEKDEGRLDWRLSAPVLERMVRALNPSPGAWFVYRDERIKVLAASLVDAAGKPGVVVDDRLTIACGEGGLRLLHLQRPGRAAMATDEWLRGYPLLAGVRLPTG
jgi:methionyl-tRNA formyltransferase